MSVANAPASSLSRFGGGTRLISSTASRTFSSSRPYATVLRSELERVAGGGDDDLSTASTMGAGVGAGASSASKLEQPTTVLVSAPKREELDPEEELVDDSEARFQISERAAEVCTCVYPTPRVSVPSVLSYVEALRTSASLCPHKMTFIEHFTDCGFCSFTLLVLIL